jgi:hypothetical protein
MITHELNRKEPLSIGLNQTSFAQFAHEVLSETGKRILKEQSAIAGTFLLKTGWLSDNLLSGIDSVTMNADGANLLIKYPDYIRFLDLKKSRYGRIKRVYHPIYNRVLYGYVYAYAFARLRAYTSETIDEYRQAIRMAYRGRLKSVLKSNITEQYTNEGKGGFEVAI